MFSQFLKKSRGFTLIEILIVIGIIAILAAIVIVAINPAKQFAQARNTQREAAVSSILNAVGQRMADNKGVFGGTFGGTYTCPTLGASSTVTALNQTTNPGDLGCLAPTYISDIPKDPSPDTTLTTHHNGEYEISVNTIGRVMVCAPSHAEAAIPDSSAYCITR